MATITQAQWNRYIQRLRSINDQAVKEFRDFVVKHGGYANIDRQVLIDYGYAIATKYGEASAALSAQMYDAVAELSGAIVPAAVPAQTAAYSDVAKTVNGIIKNTGNEDILAEGLGRLVKMAGTDTMLENAVRDQDCYVRTRKSRRSYKQRHTGAEVAWVPSGDTCPYCIMLAGAGWRKQTNWGASQHTEHVHANCDCTYMVRFTPDLELQGYDPSEYSAMYENADGGTKEEKLNSMRREAYAEHKDEINAQKRSAYEKRKERESSEAEEINVD